jgi:hypothetical protein
MVARSLVETSELRMAIRSRGIPFATRTSRIHMCTAVGSTKMMWPQCGLATIRSAHAVSLGLS